MKKDIAVRTKQVFAKDNIYPHPPEMTMSNDPAVYRRDLVQNWIHSKNAMELREIIELENMFCLLKGTTEDVLYKKLMNGSELSPSDIAKFKLFKELLVELHTLKHGQKHVNINANLKDIREIMWGEKNVNPSSE